MFPYSLMWFRKTRNFPLLFCMLVMILGGFASCGDNGGSVGLTSDPSYPTPTAGSAGLTPNPNPTRSIGLTPDPSHHTFTLAWQPPGLEDVNIKISPIIPPKQLDEYPSSYVDVTAEFKGNIVFKTDDPYYQCFEALTVSGAGMLILEAQPEASAVAGQLFIVAYNKCGPLLQQGSNKNLRAGMVAAPAIANSRSDYVVLYTFTGKPQTSGEPHIVFPDAHEEYTPITSFVGNWGNVDSKTRSWTLVEINASDNTLLATFVASSSCITPPCNASFASAPFKGNPAHMHVDEKFATRDFILSLSGDRLHVTTITHFTDNSGRADYTSEDDFYRGGSTSDGGSK